MRSITPGLKFSIRTSAVATKRCSTDLPTSFERSRTMERLLRFNAANWGSSPFRETRMGPRCMSPPGASTLTTSAPWSPRIDAAIGPEYTVVISMTRTPDSDPVMLCPPYGKDARICVVESLQLFVGGQGWNRTTDTRIFSPLLYRLSYLAG